MLVILSGLPGVGKSTVAKLLCEKMSAVYLRVDSIEQAIRDSREQYGDGKPEVFAEGYDSAYVVANDNLSLGHIVVADSVNSIEITRSAWRDVALKIGSNYIEVEVICSDLQEHKKRVETRSVSVPNIELPTWEKVMNREYEQWPGGVLQVDTAKYGAAECADLIVSHIVS